MGATHFLPKSTATRTTEMSTNTVAPYSKPLTSAFGRGWRKLPTELKIPIVAHNITYINYPITARNMNSTFEMLVAPFYSMDEEVGLIAKELFYKESMFLMEKANWTDLPRADLLPFVRHLTIRVTITCAGVMSQWLSKFEKTTAGMNLKSLQIAVRPLLGSKSGIISDRLTAFCDKKFHFRAATGNAYIYWEYLGWAWSRFSSLKETEQRLKQNMIFGLEHDAKV